MDDLGVPLFLETSKSHPVDHWSSAPVLEQGPPIASPGSWLYPNEATHLANRSPEDEGWSSNRLPEK